MKHKIFWMFLGGLTLILSLYQPLYGEISKPERHDFSVGIGNTLLGYVDNFNSVNAIIRYGYVIEPKFVPEIIFSYLNSYRGEALKRDVINILLSYRFYIPLPKPRKSDFWGSVGIGYTYANSLNESTYNQMVQQYTEIYNAFSLSFAVGALFRVHQFLSIGFYVRYWMDYGQTIDQKEQFTFNLPKKYNDNDQNNTIAIGFDMNFRL